MSERSDLETKKTSASKSKMLFSSEVDAPESPEIPWYSQKGIVAGAVLSVLWLIIALNYMIVSGWWSQRYEMTPPEFFSFISGVLFPVAFIWVSVAYLTSHRQYDKEAGKLRAYMHEFLYPGAKNKIYIKTLIEEIKEQAADLNEIYGKIDSCRTKTGSELENRIKEMKALATSMDVSTVSAASKMSETAALISFAAQDMTEQTEKNAALLHGTVEKLNTSAGTVSSSMDALNETVLSDVAVLEQARDTLTDETARISGEIREQTTLLQHASEKARTVLAEQTAEVTAEVSRQSSLIIQSGTEAHNLLTEQLDRIKDNMHTQIGLLANAGEKAQDNMAAVSITLEQQADSLLAVSEKARENADKMAVSLENRASRLEDIFERQTQALSEQDDALSQNAGKVTATFKEQNILLDQEAEKVITRFKTLEETLDMYLKEINSVSASAVEQLDDVSAELQTKANLISSASSKAQTDLNAVADTLTVRTDSISETILNLGLNAEAISTDIKTQTQGLNGALDAAVEKIKESNSDIQTHISVFESKVQEASDKSADMCGRVAKQASELSDLTGALVSQSMITETSLTQQQKYISAAAARIEEIKAGLKQQSEDLLNIADLLDTRAADSVSKLAGQLTETVEQANNIVDKINEIDVTLANETQALNASSQRIIAANSNLRGEIGRHKSLLDESTEKVSSYTEDVNARINRQVTQMDISSDLMRTRAEKTISLVDEQFRKLDAGAGTLMDNITQASALMTDQGIKLEALFNRQGSSLMTASDKLAEQTTLASSMLREQSEQVDKDLQLLVSRIKLIEEGLNLQTKELSNVSEITLNQLETVGGGLLRQTEALSEISETAKAKINDTAETLAAKAREISFTLKETNGQMQETTGSMEKNHFQFRETAQTLVNNVSALTSELQEQTENLQKQSAKSTQQTVMIRDSMQRQIIDLGDVANIVSTQSRLGEASLGQQTRYLKEAADEIMSHIHGINEAVRQNTNDLLTASSRIGFELDAMGENLRLRNEEATKSAEDSLNRSQTAAQFLEEKAVLLTRMTDQVINSINNAAKEFKVQTTQMESASDMAREQLGSTGEAFIVQTHQLNRISEEAQKAIKGFSVALRERAVDFNKTAEEANTRVRSLNETVHQIGQEFEDMSNRGVIQIDLAGQRLRGMISEVAGNSERIAAEVRKSGEQFVEQSDLLSIAADDAMNRLQDLLKLMHENADAIHSSGEKISAQSIKLGGAFNRQVQALISASKSAEEYIASLDKKKEEADTERFMKEASFIIERLQSLGVDITRLFTPNVEEDLWKRYYNGDRSAFIRYLSRAIDKNQVRKMCDMFTSDAEFRGYVSKYMGEFESVLSRAQANERSDVLLGILLGSEAGRLYMLLSRVFNKDD